MSPTEEKKLSLPVGHPEAGYVEPDLSLRDGVGTLPDDEQKAHDERDQAREDELSAIADREHEVATREAKARETGEAEAAPKAKTKSSSET